MIPYEHQETLSNECVARLKQYGLCYLASEERTGKTLTAILTCEKLKVKRVAVITKAAKRTMDGWIETLAAYNPEPVFLLSSYHQAYKLLKDKFDLVIFDEAHNYISSFPKPGKIHKEIRPLVRQTPILYLSATPHPQSPAQLYHQFDLCQYGPWSKYVNFYQWFKTYGKPYTREINGFTKNMYDRVTDAVTDDTAKYFVTKTRQDLGFEHEPEDVIHYIDLHEDTKWVYNKLQQDELVQLRAGLLVCDTTSKLRVSLHMLEGGVAKIDEDYLVLANTEKVDYIKEHFGDDPSVVIMYHFKAEKLKLEHHFKRALILQGTSNAEGVDLSGYEHLVIYSQDYSTGKHTQRRARQANKQRKTPIRVHFLLVKKAISEQVYRTVSINKRNFVDSVFNKEKL